MWGKITHLAFLQNVIGGDNVWKTKLLTSHTTLRLGVVGSGEIWFLGFGPLQHEEDTNYLRVPACLIIPDITDILISI